MGSGMDQTPVPGGDLLGRRVHALQREALRSFRAALAEAGAPPSTWLVLHELRHRPEMVQRDLADALGIGGSTLTAQLDRLEAEGLVERRGDPADRRVALVRLTPAGRELHARLYAVAERADAAMVAGLDPGEVETFRTLLERMLENVRAAGALAPAPVR
jgi:MarR family transcriptional regulator, transcriptional regulator for hemolysin